MSCKLLKIHELSNVGGSPSAQAFRRSSALSPVFVSDPAIESFQDIPDVTRADYRLSSPMLLIIGTLKGDPAYSGVPTLPTFWREGNDHLADRGCDKNKIPDRVT